MRKSIIAAVMLPLIGHAAHAAGELVWQGHAVITAVTGCDFTQVGDGYVSVYRPRDVATNGTQDRLSFIGTRGAHLVRVNGADFSGAGNYDMYGFGSRNIISSGVAAFSGASRTPATYPLPGNTSTVVVTGTIDKFFGATGCSVTFKGNYSRRLD